jgi:hypothetical protein
VRSAAQTEQIAGPQIVRVAVNEGDAGLTVIRRSSEAISITLIAYPTNSVFKRVLNRSGFAGGRFV